MEKLPYIARGVHDIPTASSVLVSSSRYLNNAQVRDWLATHFLRRNGPDRPVPADNIGLFAALDQVMDTDRIEQLFERERRINPALDRWLTERHLTYYKVPGKVVFRAELPKSLVGKVLRRMLTLDETPAS